MYIPQWDILNTVGTAESMHSRPIPKEITPSLWIHTTTNPSLILGSTQGHALIDLSKTQGDSVEVCKRSSGGGLVYISPETDCWIDFLIPSTSSLWMKDVNNAFDWVGQVWRKTLSELLPQAADRIRLHEGPLLNHETLGRLICFAGLSRGEVLVDDNKIVGLSQRRTRSGIRIQSLFTPKYSPDVYRKYLLQDPGPVLNTVDVGFPDDLHSEVFEPDEIANCLLKYLPDPS